MPVDTSRRDALQAELDQLESNREVAATRYEGYTSDLAAETERRIEATRRGADVAPIDAKIARLRQQFGIEEQAISALDADIKAKRAEVEAEKKRINRAEAEEQDETATIPSIDEAYAGAVEALFSRFAPLRDRAFTEFDRSLRLWGDVSLRDGARLTLKTDAQDRLERSGKLHCLRELTKVMQVMDVIAGTAPVPERREPRTFAYQRDRVVLPLAAPLEGRGLVMRSKEESAARVKRFDFGNQS